MRRLVFLSVLWMLSLRLALATPPSQYSATILIQNGDRSETARRFVDGSKVRTERREGGQNVVTIVRPDKKVTYLVMVDQKCYVETVLKPGAPAHHGHNGSVFKYVGPEVIDGQQTEKYAAMHEDETLGHFWLNHETKIPVKYESLDGRSIVIRYFDVKLGTQPSTLFEPPAGFTRIQAQRQAQ